MFELTEEKVISIDELVKYTLLNDKNEDIGLLYRDGYTYLFEQPDRYDVDTLTLYPVQMSIRVRVTGTELEHDTVLALIVSCGSLHEIMYSDNLCVQFKGVDPTGDYPYGTYVLKGDKI